MVHLFGTNSTPDTISKEVPTILLVIPDSTALYSDPFIEGASIKTILAAESYTDIRLVIPQVVVDELRNQVEEMLRKAIKDTEKVRRDYAKMSGQSIYSIDIMISSDERKVVLERFDKRMQQLGEEGRILNYPSPSPRDLAHRSIRAKPPFGGNDRGMRDTLIWLTAKESASTGVGDCLRVILVTNDKAFWDKDKRNLNESLQEEIEEAGISRKAISIQPSLKDVIARRVSSELPHVEWVKVAIEGDQLDEFTADSEEVILRMTDWIYENPEVFDGLGYISVDFDVVEDVSLSQIERVLDLGSGEILVETKWRCNAGAEGFDNPHFGDYLSVILQFSLSSLLKANNRRLSIVSHEVTDVYVEEVIEN